MTYRVNKNIGIGLGLLLFVILFSSCQREVEVAPLPSRIVVYNNSGYLSGNVGETQSGRETIMAVKEIILERTGVEVDVIPAIQGLEEQKLNIYLMSNEKIDAFWGNWEKYAATDMIIPIQDLVEEWAPSVLPMWPKESTDMLTDREGNLWGLPRVGPQLGNSVWIRKDWCDELGLDFPRTIEELELVMAAFKREKPGGDDTIVLISEIHGKHGSNGVFSSFEGAFTPYGVSNWLDAEGNIKPHELQPGFKDFIAKLNEWYKKGYIYPEFASLDKEKIRELVKGGRVGVAATWYSNVANVHYELNKIYPDADFRYIEEGLEGEWGKAETVKPATTQAFLISSTCEKPEDVLKVMELFYSDPESYVISAWGPRGELWDWQDESKGLYNLLSDRQGYRGEYNFAVGLPITQKAATTAPQTSWEAFFWGFAGLGSNPPAGLDFSRGKMVVDSGVIYSPEIILSEIPGYNELNRFKEEEIVKFIIGYRPIEEWDNFVDEMYEMGMDTWIEVHTRIYNEQKL